MHITIASNGEDWAAVYFDGKKVDSGHEICWEDVLALLGHTVSRAEVDPEEEAAGFPDSLLPACPACKSNARVEVSANFLRGSYFCPCNEPSPSGFFEEDGSTRDPGAACCAIPPEGWVCSRKRGHSGPCAAYPADRLNGGCPFCGKGVFTETSTEDDRDGVLHCSSCNLQIQRYS